MKKGVGPSLGFCPFSRLRPCSLLVIFVCEFNSRTLFSHDKKSETQRSIFSFSVEAFQHSSSSSFLRTNSTGPALTADGQTVARCLFSACGTHDEYCEPRGLYFFGCRTPMAGGGKTNRMVMTGEKKHVAHLLEMK